jgi:GDP-D-mannose dehydratase
LLSTVENLSKIYKLGQIGTGEAHSVREFLDEAFGYLNMDWHAVVQIDPRYYRPNEVDFLQADPGKARRVLDWKPRSQNGRVSSCRCT